MKRIYTLLVMVCFIMLMTSTDFNAVSSPADVSPLKRQRCHGYTVVEAGKGIDCHGDTITLVKQHGFYEIASRSKPGKTRELVLD